MTVVLMTAVRRFVGLSSDTKPVGIPAGSTFEETDTLLRYIFDGSTWKVLP